MSIDLILNSTAFASLDAEGKAKVGEVLGEYESIRPVKRKRIPDDDVVASANVSDAPATLPFDFKTLFEARNKKSLDATIAYWNDRLNEINPETFHYNETRDEVLDEELQFATFIYLAQYHLDEKEKRRQTLAFYQEKIEQCRRLRRLLAKEPPEEVEESPPPDDINELGKPLRFLGIQVIAPVFVESIMACINGKLKSIRASLKEKAEAFTVHKTGTIIQEMSSFNEKRLYWVWGSGLISSVISMLPQDYAYAQQANNALQAPAPTAGYISWTLYYTRFGINLGLLLKHTFRGPWVKPEEAEEYETTTAWERFKTQWQFRKFTLLNDLIWGTINLLCFYWLVGPGKAGYAGNILTGFLLLFDISMTIWRMCEANTEQNRAIERFNNEIKVLEALQTEKMNMNAQAEEALRKARLQNDAEEIKKQETILLEMAKDIAKRKEQLKHLYEEKDKYVLNATYDKYQNINDLVYSISLLIGFGVMCTLFFPPTFFLPATTLILGVAGAALTFVLTMAYAMVKERISIARIEKLEAQTTEKRGELFKQLQEMLADPKADENTKKLLYLDIMQLDQTAEMHKEQARFQKLVLIRSVAIDALVPPVIILSTVFLPLGLGFAVIAAGFILAGITSLILKRFDPDNKIKELPKFDQMAYESFIKKHTAPQQKLSQSRQSFLSHDDATPQPGSEPESEQESESEPESEPEPEPTLKRRHSWP